MDLWEYLKDDHRAVDALMLQIMMGAGNREGPFDELRQNLERHALSEEELFYPALEKHAETRDQARHSREEHAKVKTMLQTLSQGDIGSPEWMAQLRELQESVQHHVREEEEQIFPKAQKAIPPEQAEEILRGMQKMKQPAEAGA